MDDKVQYWIDLAEYDLETAQVMLESRRLLYVGFMCHQAIEKLLKACHVAMVGDSPPRTHDLRVLARKSNLYEKLTDEQRDFVDLLMPLNIEGRYPTDRDRLIKELTPARGGRILQETQELFKWIREQFLTK